MRSRRLRRTAVAVAVLASVVGCVSAALPLLVNADAVKHALERQVARATDGTVGYESVSLHLFPQVRAEFSGATVRVPRLVEGRIPGIQVRIAWWPLLSGEVRPTAVRIERPALEWHIAPGGTADPFEAYHAALGRIADALARHAPGTSVRIEQGSLGIVQAGRRVVSLSGFDGVLEISEQTIIAKASAASDLWRAARCEFSMTPASLAASGKLQVTGLRTALPDSSASRDAPHLRVDGADATIEMATDGRGMVRGTLTASAPQVTLVRGGRTLELGAARISLDLNRDGNVLAIALREFRAGDLVPAASGTLRAKPDGTTPVLELRLPALDLERAGTAALAFAGDLEPVRGAVDRVKSGALRELTLHSAAIDVNGLADPSSMRAEAELDAAVVAVPEAGILIRQGSARFALTYEARRKPSPLVLEFGGVRATGHHRSVPFPVTVSGGDLRISGNAVLVRNLAGSAGGSSVSNWSMDIALGTEPVIRAASGDATLVLGETFPWLGRIDGLQPLLGDVKSATGTAALRLARLSGSLSRPGALDFDITVEPRQVRLTSAVLPGPLTVAAGSISATPRALRLEALQAALLDARVTTSGTVENYAAPERRVNLALEQGSSGSEAIQWARQRWNLPAGRMPRAPVALSAGRVEWTGGTFAAQGSGSLAAGAQVAFDLAWRPGHLDVRRFALKDEDSDAALRVQWSPQGAELEFNGRLHHRTLERSLAQPPQTRAMLQGDFRAAIDLAAPRRSTATGNLLIEGLDLHEHAGVPVDIDRLMIDATGRTLHVRDSVVRLAGERLALSGTVESRAEKFAIDARVSAETLDAARLIGAFPRARVGEGATGAAWNLPLEGQIAVTAAAAVYGEHALRSLAGSVTLAPDRVGVVVSDARLCGVSAPFAAALTPGSVEARVQLNARGQALESLLRCLTGEQFAATGTYDLDAELAVSGPARTLLTTARGTFRLAARNGRIHRAEALGRALEVDEVAKRLDTAPRSLLTQGLEYGEIAVAGSLEGPRVRLDHGLIDSPRLGMTVNGEVSLADGSLALQGLIAPLESSHRLLRRTPLAGRALGSALVVVPLDIGGTVSDPQVRVLAAAAVGATLINLMTAKFLLPLDLFDMSRSQPSRSLP